MCRGPQMTPSRAAWPPRAASLRPLDYNDIDMLTREYRCKKLSGCVAVVTAIAKARQANEH